MQDVVGDGADGVGISKGCEVDEALEAIRTEVQLLVSELCLRYGLRKVAAASGVPQSALSRCLLGAGGMGLVQLVRLGRWRRQVGVRICAALFEAILGVESGRDSEAVQSGE